MMHVSIIGTVLLLCMCTCARVVLAVPSDCSPVEDHVLDTFDPRTVFEASSEIAQHQPPMRVGNLRNFRPIPTGHFATSQLKHTPQPMVLWPYFASMDTTGIIYEPTEFRRLTDPNRTIIADQQTPWEAGKPWNRLLDLGINMFQRVSGPDGNPTSVFDASMDSTGIIYDPTEFQRFTDPNRTIIADQQTPWEAGKPWNRLLDLGTNMFQRVSGPDGNPTGVFDDKTGVRVGIQGSGEPVLDDFGDLYANFRYKGANSGNMEVPLVRGSILLTHIFENANPVVTPNCLDSINGEKHTFDCHVSAMSSNGGTGFLGGSCVGSTLTITVHNTRPVDLSKLQYAVNTASQYGSSHGMRNCDPAHCTLKEDGQLVEITVPNASGTMNFAVNYIGAYVLPSDWIHHPAHATCHSGKKRAVTDISVQATCDAAQHAEIRVDLSGQGLDGIDTVQYALESAQAWGHPPAMHTCDPSVCSRQGDYVVISKTVTSSNLMFAVNVIGRIVVPYQDWINHPLTFTCGSGQTVTYGGVFGSTQGSSSTQTQTQAPGATTQTPQHTAQPTTHAPTHAHTTASSGGTGGQTHTLTPGTKFILELNEQGKELPNQTRKFVLYFSEAVTPHVHRSSQTITFEPRSGGSYNGIMQMAYIGSGPRGDRSNADMYDPHAGVYSYKPKASFCVSESAGKAYATFDWRPNNQHAASPMSSLIMMVMKHHEYILQRQFSDHMSPTSFGFKGYSGGSWELEMDLPRADMSPEQAGVDKILADPTKKAAFLAAIARDAANQNLDDICGWVDSYGVGKSIGMVARLASISRAANTDHYRALDTSIKNCLERWLRIQDTLKPAWHFHYDTVWGGLYLRATAGSDVGWGLDFGFPYYNDHHFHLGYFIYAAAYYAKHHQSWAQTHKHQLYTLVRDVSNPSPRDPFFPTFRQKDVYTGFSWASGIVPGTRQEESASESLNCYHGVAALGDAMNDKVLQHTGQVMLAMEVASVREYWQVRQHNHDNFPPIIQKTGVVGQIAEDSFYVYTLNWPCGPNIFPMRHACLVGIQVIPITSVSKYWMDKEWAASIEHSCTSAIHPEREAQYSIADHSSMRQLDGGWAAFCHAAMAPLDSAHQGAAAAFVKDRRPQDLVGGTGAASTLLFIWEST